MEYDKSLLLQILRTYVRNVIVGYWEYAEVFRERNVFVVGGCHTNIT